MFVLSMVTISYLVDHLCQTVKREPGILSKPQRFCCGTLKLVQDVLEIRCILGNCWRSVIAVTYLFTKVLFIPCLM